MFPLIVPTLQKGLMHSEASFQRRTPKHPMAINCLIKNSYEEGDIFHVNYKAFWNYSKETFFVFMQKYLSYCNWEPKDFTEKKSTKIVIFLRRLATGKMFSWKKKKKTYREPPLENIQQAYQGFNSCKRTLACLPLAQPVSCFWNHWSCFLPCHFVLLIALIHFFELGRRLCSSYSNTRRVSTSSGWDPASFSRSPPTLWKLLFTFTVPRITICLSIWCLSAMKPPATSPTLRDVCLWATAATSGIALWASQLSTSHQK